MKKHQMIQFITNIHNHRIWKYPACTGQKWHEKSDKTALNQTLSLHLSAVINCSISHSPPLS